MSRYVGVGIWKDGGVDVEIVCSAYRIHKHFGRKGSMIKPRSKA